MENEKINTKIESSKKSRNEIIEFLKRKDYSSKDSLKEWIEIINESFWNNLAEISSYKYKEKNNIKIIDDFEREERLKISEDDKKEFEKCCFINRIIKAEIKFMMSKNFINKLKLRYRSDNNFNSVEIENFLDNEKQNIELLKEQFENLDKQIDKLKKINWYGEEIKDNRKFSWMNKSEFKMFLIFSIISFIFYIFFKYLKKRRKNLQKIWSSC